MRTPDPTPPPRADSSETLATLVALVPGLKLLVGLAVGTIVIAGLYFGREILIPLALAFLLGFVLDPLVGRLRRWGLPRAPAVIVVVLVAMGALVGAGLLLGSQVRQLSAELPTYQQNIKSKLSNLRESMRAPGVFDGALKTFDTLQREVEGTPAPVVPPVATGTRRGANAAAAAASASTPLRVQVEETPPSPFRQAMGWLKSASGPLADAGIVLVFVVLVLLDRLDLRDRLVRLMGGSLHRATDAMDEAGARIGKYLTMQLIVNLTYGVPMALGLWLIGVPGALLWGAVAAVMRFVPYVGPMISAVFPLALAFAIDPGWSLVLWTLGLIVVLELVSNNIVEPWLYGASTGLSAMSLMVAATFWTALWGPVGLIMATPLTVCLLVIGRHLPQLQFLDVLLGSQPALDAPTRVYQRLLAGDVEEAIELSGEQVETAGSVVAFYSQTGVPVLRMAVGDHASAATVEHRLRLVSGMEALLDDLAEQHPGVDAGGRPRVVCIGGKWEVDTLGARMLAHALALDGHGSACRPAALPDADYIARLDLRGVEVVCVSYFSPEPQVRARYFCRRLRRQWPRVRIVLALWNAPAELLAVDPLEALGADAVAVSVEELAMRVGQLLGADAAEGFMPAPIPEEDHARVRALRASGALDDERLQALFALTSKRAADIFDVPLAMVSLIDEQVQVVRSAHGSLPGVSSAPGDLNMPREVSMCGHVVANAEMLVVPDLARDPRFAGNAALRGKGLRFYAGAPLRDGDGHVLGSLCILDVVPRELDVRERRLLQAMADDLMEVARGADSQLGALDLRERTDAADAPVQPPSATVGQPVPG